MENAFSSNQGFISFSTSPEPEAAPSAEPSAFPPTTATASSRRDEQLASRSTKRSREEREREDKQRRDEREDDDPDKFRNRKEERRAGNRNSPWVDGVDWLSCRNPAEMLNREITSFVSYISPTPTEHATRSHIIALIRQAVVGQWRDAEVSPFGSYETGLYLPTGDIDLVIVSPSMEKQNKVSVLHTLAAVLRRANLAENIQVISKAKVPIVKFISSYGRLPVDISINQSNGISAGKIVNSYISALPALKPLVLVIKAFLNQRGMNEVYSGGLGSYSVICLVISFLQVHPKVRRAEIDPLKNLGVLLIEFFELYGKNFGYDETGISLREGGYYYSKEDKGWSNERQRYLLSIEDPQDTSNDISRGSHGILRVKSTFSGAYEVLTSRLYIRAEGIARRRSAGGASHKRFDERDGRGEDVSEMSILVGIMGVTAEVLSQRRTLQDLHRSGRLQDRLGISRNAPVPDLPSFMAPPPPRTSARSPPRVAQPQARVSAIHVEDERSIASESTSGSEDERDRGESKCRRDRRRGTYDSDSYSDVGEFDFVDQPFKPAGARKTADDGRSGSGTRAPPLPAPTRATASTTSRKPRSASPDDRESRYNSVGKQPAVKKRKGNQDAFAAPTSVISIKGKGKAKASRDSTPEEGEISDSDSEGSRSSNDDSLYRAGKAELVDTDDSDFEDQERKFRAKKKAERRQARQAKRNYWASKGGDSSMDYGGLLSD